MGKLTEVTMIHVLIAPNAFKNSLTATVAADAIREGLHEKPAFLCVRMFSYW